LYKYLEELLKGVFRMKKSLSPFLALTLLWSGSLLAEVKELKVDATESYVAWVGKKVTGEHNGIVKVSEGKVQVEDGVVVGGSFAIDMSSIKNNDIESDKWRNKLETHLKSDDFFNIETFPKSTFTIKEVAAGNEGEQILKGDLTIKGITLPVSLPASIKQEEGKYIGTGKIVLDRAKWDIKYNSGKFFDPNTLGDKLIYDDIAIEVKVVALEA
jgi:polyisoprenoid-binding protein YceI